MKNFLTIKTNGAVTMIKKEHIVVVPYISKEIEIYTTSGRWEVSELLTTLRSGSFLGSS